MIAEGYHTYLLISSIFRTFFEYLDEFYFGIQKIIDWN